MTNTKQMKLIGTKDTGHAPAPKKGVTRALYLCLDAIGESNVDRINRMGYLVQHDGLYRVAPLSYYNARREHIEANKANPGKRPRKRLKEATPVTITRPFWHWTVLGHAVAVSFLVGLLAGMFIA